jgi:hypothetical protein
MDSSNPGSHLLRQPRTLLRRGGELCARNLQLPARSRQVPLRGLRLALRARVLQPQLVQLRVRRHQLLTHRRCRALRSTAARAHTIT